MTPLQIEIPQPDDWHVHLRDDEMLAAVVDYTARRFRIGMVMPNLASPVVRVADAAAYRNRIIGAMQPGSGFDPWMTLYCSHDVDLDDLRAGIRDGVVRAVKYYPAGATTNSAAGGTAMADFMRLYEVLAATGTRLLVHAESTDPDVDIFDREAHFIETQLAPLCDRMPELAVTVEHLSTAAGVAFVRDHPSMAGTITPHHLARDRSDLLASGLEPDLYCKPIVNSPADRVALVDAATAGRSSFALGTDSAPHVTASKYRAGGSAGVFNAAYGLEVVAEVFHRAGRLDRLAAFVSGNGCAIYGVEPPASTVLLQRVESRPEEHVSVAGDAVVHFGRREAAQWQVLSAAT